MQKYMYVANSTRQAGSAASLAANNKVTKYDQLTRTHATHAIELVEEIGKRITDSTDDQRRRRICFSRCSWHFKGETRFLFKVPSLPCCNPLFSLLLNICVLCLAVIITCSTVVLQCYRRQCTNLGGIFFDSSTSILGFRVSTLRYKHINSLEPNITKSSV